MICENDFYVKMASLLPQKIMSRLTYKNKRELYDFSCEAFKIIDYLYPVKSGKQLSAGPSDKEINQLLKLVSKFVWLEKQDKKIIVDLIPYCVEESEINSKYFPEIETTKKDVFAVHIAALKERIEKDL